MYSSHVHSKTSAPRRSSVARESVRLVGFGLSLWQSLAGPFRSASMNAKYQVVLLVLSLGVAVQGCMLKSETVHFAPKLEARQTDVGEGTVLGLEVADI